MDLASEGTRAELQTEYEKADAQAEAQAEAADRLEDMIDAEQN